MVTEQYAKSKHDAYMEEGLRMFPPFKGYGLKFIEFAVSEPECFQLLFLSQKKQTVGQYMEVWPSADKLLPVIQRSLELSEADARWLFKNMIPCLLGLSVQAISGVYALTQEEISLSLGTLCKALLMSRKFPRDARVRMIPDEMREAPGKLSEYLGRRIPTIIGYGNEKELYQIPLDQVLYFEAVGEKVFCYTKADVFEIKKRLYQVEDEVRHFYFMRAAKALIVNLDKIRSICPETSGRGKITMINDEIVLVSRAYYRDVVDALKNQAE